MNDRRPGEGANAVVTPIDAAANAAITLPLAMVDLCAEQSKNYNIKSKEGCAGTDF